MVEKCKVCGQYRMHLNKDGVCNICLAEERDKDDLNITVKGLESRLEKAEKQINLLETHISRQGRLIDGLQKRIRNLKEQL